MKRFAVRCLAEYIEPPDVVEALRETFADDPEAAEALAGLTTQQLTIYDASTSTGRARLSEDLKALFWEWRKAEDGRVEQVPIASRAYRLRRLQALLDDRLLSKSPKVVMGALEQAAKEVGGLFNARQAGATDDEVDEYVRERVEDFKAAVRAHVSDRAEADRAIEAVKKAGKERLAPEG